MSPIAGLPLPGEPVHLRLYVAGNAPHSLRAVEHAGELCRRHLGAQDSLDVIDLSAHPDLAISEQLVALPALVRMDGQLRRVWVGELTDTPRVLSALGIGPRSLPQPGTPPPPPGITSAGIDAWLAGSPSGPRLIDSTESGAAYRQLIETASEGSATLAADGTVLYANRCLAQWLEVEPGRLAGRTLWEFLDPPGEQHVRNLMTAARGGQAAADVLVRTASVHGRLLRFSFSDLSDGTVDRLGLVVTDVEELRRTVAELDWQREHLEVEVHDRTQALQQALQVAQDAGRARTSFLASMSHEIRTPLNGILGMAHVMRLHALPADQSERLGKIEAAGRHLLGLLTDILELSRIDAQRILIEPAPLEPASLLQRVADLVGEAAHSKGLALLIEPPPALPGQVLGDVTRLTQSLLNLASNAVKFTDQGHVLLRLKLEQAENTALGLRYEVDDTGPGIAPEVAARLFQPFERGVHAAAQRTPGTGLGLAITLQLARLMGGQAGVEPRPGGGSRFWFTVRLQRPEAGDAPGEAPRSESPSLLQLASQVAQRHAGAHVLLVEDEPTNVEVARGLLQAAGLEVTVVTDGIEAVEQVAGEQPIDLILMDMNLPVLDGLGATRQIRTLPGGDSLPILAMTANAFTEDRARCVAAGMSDFVPKPIDPVSFFGKLLYWLGRRGATSSRPAPPDF